MVDFRLKRKGKDALKANRGRHTKRHNTEMEANTAEGKTRRPGSETKSPLEGRRGTRWDDPCQE